MAPRETPKPTTKVQRTVKDTPAKGPVSLVGAIKKPIQVKKTVNKTPLKINNTTEARATRQRTSTVPKVQTPKPTTKVQRTVKDTPAKGRVSLVGAIKKPIQVKKTVNKTPLKINNTTEARATRQRTSTVPKVQTPKPTTKVQRTVKDTPAKGRVSLVGAIKKPIQVKKTVNKTPLKINNTTEARATRQRTSTVPKVQTPKPTTKVQRTVKDTPAKGRVSLVGAIKKPIQVKKTVNKTPLKINNTTEARATRQRTSTVPKVQTPKPTTKVQCTVKDTPAKGRVSLVGAIKKPIQVKKTVNIPLKINNTTEARATRQRTSTVPKVQTPKPKDNRSVPVPSSVTKSGKKPSWKRRPKPAHSGVPIPEKMRLLLEKQFKESEYRHVSNDFLQFY